MSRPRLHFQNDLALIALLAGLPATAIAMIAIWRSLDTLPLRIVAGAALLVFWVGGALWLRRRLTQPLQTTANLVEAIRYGDYSLRGRRARRGDVLGEVLIEINQLGEALGRERISAVEASALVQAILAEIDTAVFAFDQSGVLRIVNRAGADLMARSAESLQGRSAGELGLAELLGAAPDNLVTTAPWQFPGRGGRFEIHQRAFRQGGVSHKLIVVTDVSRALRDEERVAWQKLIRVLGHEINNSLTPIKSLAQTLRGSLIDGVNALPTDDVDASLQIIVERADNLARFVASYSQLARLPGPVLAPIELQGLLAKIVGVPDCRSVQLLKSEPLIAAIDSGQITQAITNLVRNACEAVASTGGAVTLSLSEEAGFARIDVIDDGEGVANPANLFVPFFTTKARGSGIGLALSRQIVDGHGGRLQLENRRDGRGCIASVYLPLAKAMD